MNIFKSKRSICRLCESKNLEMVIPLAPTPVAEKYLNKNQLNQEEIICPLDLYICKICRIYDGFCLCTGGYRLYKFKIYLRPALCKPFTC